MRLTTLSAAVILALTIVTAVPAAAQQAFSPEPTLADQMAQTEITFAPGYLQARPRLILGPDDIAALKQKADANPELWQRVQRQAESLGKYVPTPEEISTAGKYWRVEYVLSGAVAYLVTGEQAHRDNTVKWMIAHCAEDVWGTGYGSNVDLHAAWYLYYISLAYDLLHDTFSDVERNAIRAGLISHAQAIYESKLPPQEYRYDQNHTYIPTTALATAALTLAGEVPQADTWLKLAAAMLNRCRYALGDDGYYYEGTGYWQYAIHWHVRYADMAARAFGGQWHDLPTLRHNWLFPLHMSVPGSPFMWDIGDGGSGALKRPANRKLAWNHMLYSLAGVLNDGKIRAVADWLAANSQDADDPAMHLLWVSRAADVKPVDPATLPPYHHFTDHDVVAWRSGWDDNATCYAFKAGPPQGHAATAKLRQMTDWKMNSGHVHPDIGAFWIFAGGEYLAVDTGYAARKRTDDHNTLLVDGRGQGKDVDAGGEGDVEYYWIYRGLPYEAFDKVRITKTYLTKDYGYAVGTLGSAYDPKGELGGLSMERHVVMTKQWFVVIDDLTGAKPHQYAWLMHTDTPIAQVGEAFESRKGNMRLLTYDLSPTRSAHQIGPTTVFAGTSPGEGKPEQRGYQLELRTPGQVASTRFITLMLPLGKDAPAPRLVRLSRSDEAEVVVRIHWADRAPTIMKVDLTWKPGDPKGPVWAPDIGLKLPGRQ